MYKLTDNPDIIIRVTDGACIPRGHRWWDEYEEWLAQGNTPEPVAQPTRAQFELAIRDGVYRWLDSIAQGNDYDNVISCLTYLTSDVPKFKAEAVAMLKLRDAVAVRLIELQQDSPEGVATLEQVIALMPKPEDFGWVRDPTPNVGPSNEEAIHV